MDEKGKGIFMNKIKEYVKNNKMKTVRAAVIAIVVIAAVFVFFFRTGEQEKIPVNTDTAKTEQQAEKTSDSQESGEDAAVNDSDTVIVDIGGQVVTPQVLELPKNSRISDAIEAADGLTKKADLSTINRAQLLSDGEKIYIPAKGEETPAIGSSMQGGSSSSSEGTAASSGGSPGQASSGKININTADSTALQQITGVGPVTAEKIITYREQTPFRKIEDLKNVSGIGDKTFEKMKDQVTV